jgi:hypothetical protein
MISLLVQVQICDFFFNFDASVRIFDPCEIFADKPGVVTQDIIAACTLTGKVSQTKLMVEKFIKKEH